MGIRLPENIIEGGVGLYEGLKVHIVDQYYYDYTWKYFINDFMDEFYE